MISPFQVAEEEYKRSRSDILLSLRPGEDPLLVPAWSRSPHCFAAKHCRLRAFENDSASGVADKEYSAAKTSFTIGVARPAPTVLRFAARSIASCRPFHESGCEQNRILPGDASRDLLYLCRRVGYLLIYVQPERMSL